ncbi:apolipoprotein A1/A4/E family protein [Helicobacter suis]|uniref:apolipoprotein A1/A4/E family protein n=1 Tax=Helicobacter suis TaxID=104628 RepID=UPI0013D554E1|nr:apolipoprotein A1/A4/E family protein [Helicobacter suis]
MCLQGLSRLLSAFISFRELQDTSLKELPKIEARAAYMQYCLEQVRNVIDNYNSYFDEFNYIMGKNNALIVQNFQIVQDKITLANNVLTQANLSVQEIIKYRDEIQALLVRLNSLPHLKDELNNLYSKTTGYLEDLKKANAEALNNIKEHLEAAQNALNSLEGELDSKLEQKAKELQGNLNILENTIQTKVDQRLSNLDNLIQTHKTEAQAKLAEMQRYLAVAVKLRDYAQATYKALDHILKDALDQILKHTSTQKELLTSHTDSLTTTSKEDIKEYKKSMIEEFNKDSAPIGAEIATLKTMLEQLQVRSTKLGLDFSTTTYTENASFEVPKSGIYYFVFLQAGAGNPSNTDSNSNNSITSFGDKLSIASGNGATTGAIKCGWIKLENQENIAISVGSGGLCVVSYATALRLEDVAKNSIATTEPTETPETTQNPTEGEN